MIQNIVIILTFEGSFYDSRDGIYTDYTITKFWVLLRVYAIN